MTTAQSQALEAAIVVLGEIRFAPKVTTRERRATRTAFMAIMELLSDAHLARMSSLLEKLEEEKNENDNATH